jgi:group I intron endonuclease
MSSYGIYKITSPTGRVYIGQSINPLGRMKSYRKCDRKQRLLYYSIQKHGYENHKFEVVIENLTKIEADDEEIVQIRIYKELKKSLNISEGGTLVGKLRQKAIIQFSLEGELIKEHNGAREAGRTVGKSGRSIALCANRKTFYAVGFLWVYKQDYEKGITPIWINKNVTTIQKEVYQFDIHGNLITRYSSIEECAREMNLHPQSIRANILGKTEKCNSFIFSHFNKFRGFNKSRAKNSRIVLQFDKTGNYIKGFANAKVAAEQLNLSYKQINKCLNNAEYSYKSFRFKY